MDFVKQRREDVDPNEGFLNQLREFESLNMDFGRVLFNRGPSPTPGRLPEQEFDDQEFLSDSIAEPGEASPLEGGSAGGEKGEDNTPKSARSLD
jgi:hypothetical protein